MRGPGIPGGGKRGGGEPRGERGPNRPRGGLGVGGAKMTVGSLGGGV